MLHVHADKYDFEWRSALYGLPVCDLWCGLDAGVEARQAVLVLHPLLYPVYHIGGVFHLDPNFVRFSPITHTVVLLDAQLRNKLHLKRHLRLVRALLFLLGDFGDGLRVDPYRCIDKSWHL